MLQTSSQTVEQIEVVIEVVLPKIRNLSDSEQEPRRPNTVFSRKDLKNENWNCLLYMLFAIVLIDE